jgi:hypothetical protein
MNMWLARMCFKYSFLKSIVLYFYPNLNQQILLVQLMDLMLKENIERVQEGRNAKENRERIRLQNAAEQAERIKKRQDRCNHLKGGKYRSGMIKDYALGDHIFPDRSRKIWCLICAKTFTPDEAAEMLHNSTNTRSSSEITMGPLRDRLVVQEAYTEEQKKEAMNPDRPDEYDEKFWKNVVNRQMVLVGAMYDEALKTQQGPVVPENVKIVEPEIMLDKETKKAVE